MAPPELEKPSTRLSATTISGARLIFWGWRRFR